MLLKLLSGVQRTGGVNSVVVFTIKMFVSTDCNRFSMVTQTIPITVGITIHTTEIINISMALDNHI